MTCPARRSCLISDADRSGQGFFDNKGRTDARTDAGPGDFDHPGRRGVLYQVSESLIPAADSRIGIYLIHWPRFMMAAAAGFAPGAHAILLLDQAGWH
jgi:hypothetical protein